MRVTTAPRKNAILRGIGVLLLLSTLAYAAAQVRMFLLVDNCLDDGGCWDKEEMRCEFQDQQACDEGR